VADILLFPINTRGKEGQYEQMARIGGNRAGWLGVIEVPTAEAAIKEFNITDPQEQKRVGAMPDS
jgi:hypothetical protein